MTSPKKKPASGDFIVLKKTSTASSTKENFNEHEEQKMSHKKYFNQGRKSPMPQEMKVCNNEIELNKGKVPPNEDLNILALNAKASSGSKLKSIEGKICVDYDHKF